MYDYAKAKGFITDEDRYLESITERQDICVNMTKMSNEEVMTEIEIGAKRLNKLLKVGLEGNSLIKTKGYKNQRIKKTLEVPQEQNIASLGNKSTSNSKKMKRNRNDVSFNYSRTDFKFEDNS
jgi:hypothetical protein